MFVVRERESGNIIDEFETLKEAEEALLEYEEMDHADEIYSPDFYEIVEA